MKTSFFWYVFLFLLGGMATLAAQNVLFVKAVAQHPPTTATEAAPRAINVRGDGSTTEFRADGTIIERLKDGRTLQTSPAPTIAVEQLPDGRYIQRPVFTPDGGAVLLGGGPTADPEAAKLLEEELQATRAAQKLWNDFRSADSDGKKETIKTELREALNAIFDLQQKRRASEIEKIEERIAKLKETMQKRDAAKEDIVNRRLDVLTGGIDELGWEDTFRQLGPGSPFATPQYGPPVTSPGPAFLPHPSTRGALPSPTPVPGTPAPPTRPFLPSTTPGPAEAAPAEDVLPSAAPAPATSAPPARTPAAVPSAAPAPVPQNPTEPSASDGATPRPPALAR